MTTAIKEKIKTYEIYCENFSQIIQAENLFSAVDKFGIENPFEKIILAQDINYSKGDESKGEETEWKWNDDLVKEMIYSKLPIPDHYIANVQKCLDEFKEYKNNLVSRDAVEKEQEEELAGIKVSYEEVAALLHTILNCQQEVFTSALRMEVVTVGDIKAAFDEYFNIKEEGINF